MKKSILFLFIPSFSLFFLLNSANAELRNNMPADVVVGQPDFTTGSSGTTRNKLQYPYGVYSDGKRLFIADTNNNRVFIYNAVPTTNGASPDIVIGQPDFTTTSSSTTQSKFWGPIGVYSDGKHLFISERYNNRVLIYNTIPTTNGVPADIVLGQPDFTTSTPGTSQSKFSTPRGVFTDGKRLYITETGNNRVLIYNTIPTTNGAPADIVIGQPDFATGTEGTTRNNLYWPSTVWSDGKRLLISDWVNNRILIYNSIPTTNGAPADIVIGQTDFTTRTADASRNKFNGPYGIFSDGKRLFIADNANHRALIYDSIPTTNYTPADIVIGQPDFTTNAAGTSQYKFNEPIGIFSDGKRLFVTEGANDRVLIYNIGGSSIDLGPQFEQGKAVLGKVFNDVNGNGIQDSPQSPVHSSKSQVHGPSTMDNGPQAEQGIEGVKVVSDTGIYAITDEDGKYHFPYIETGQHLLKVDPVTLPEGATFTTDNPYKVTVTKGILTKVSFGVKLPESKVDSPQSIVHSSKSQDHGPSTMDNGPLLKVSITQDPVMLKPKLAISTTQDKENITFKIDCNYFLFIEKSKLNIYNQDYKLIKSIELPQPIPSKYLLPISALPNNPINPINAMNYYYQLCVYDKHNREDRTAVGSFKVE